MFRHTIFTVFFAVLLVLPVFSAPLKDINGNEVINNSSVIVMCDSAGLGGAFSGDLLLAAKWEPFVYEFVLDDKLYANNTDESGTNPTQRASESVYYRYGDGMYADSADIGDENHKIENINVPGNDNYYFKGFFTQKYNGGTKIIGSNGQIVSDSREVIPEGGINQTLYAQWCMVCDATNASCELSVVNNQCTYTTSCNSGYGNIQNNGAYNASCSGNSYTITYTMNDGTNYENAPTSYTYGVGVTIDGVPTREGYTFEGWCTNSDLTNCAMSQTIGLNMPEDKTFYAKWAQCAACDATNASCELSVVNNQCTYTTSCNSGYGNIQNNGAYNASCSGNSYTITYTMNDGTNYENAPISYTYGVGVTIDGVPTREGYTFEGWCTNSDLTNCAMSQTIRADEIGNQIFYAKWQITCKAGTYLSADTKKCMICPEDHYCTGDTWTGEQSKDMGIIACSTKISEGFGPRSPAGSTKLEDCGHILRMGDGDANKLYLHADKNKDGPSFVVEIDGKPWYASMTAVDDDVLKPISSKDGAKKFYIDVNGTEYTVHGRYVE